MAIARLICSRRTFSKAAEALQHLQRTEGSNGRPHSPWRLHRYSKQMGQAERLVFLLLAGKEIEIVIQEEKSMAPPELCRARSETMLRNWQKGKIRKPDVAK